MVAFTGHQSHPARVNIHHAASAPIPKSLAVHANPPPVTEFRFQPFPVFFGSFRHASRFEL